jgi:hypothetical protein
LRSDLEDHHSLLFIERISHSNSIYGKDMTESTIEDAELELWLQQLEESDMSVKLDAASRVTSVIQRLAPRHHVRVLRALLQSLSFRDTALIEHVVPAVSHVTRGLIAQHEKSQVTVLAPVTRVVLGPKMADRLEAAKQASFTEYNEPVNSTAALVDELLDKLVYEFKYITNNAQLKIYMRYVPSLMESAGPHVIKHLKPLLNHVLYLLTVADDELTRDLLSALQVIVRHCWTRMDYHAQEIFQALLAVYIEHWGTSDAEFIRDLIAELLIALKLCVSAAHWQELLEALQASEELRTLHSRVK